MFQWIVRVVSCWVAVNASVVVAAEPERPELRGELLAMREIDQSLRRALGQRPAGDGADARRDADLLAELQRVDTLHATRLRAIVDEHGWPTISMVGRDGSRAAWLLVQHATHDLELMERALSLMGQLAERGEAVAVDVAYLHDRVQMMTGKPQRYGTQFITVTIDGVRHSGPWPMESPEDVDERRRSVGLGAFSEYRKRMDDGLQPIPPDMSIEAIRAVRESSGVR